MDYLDTLLLFLSLVHFFRVYCLFYCESEGREGGEIDTNLSPFIRYCQFYSISDKKKSEDMIDSYTGPGKVVCFHFPE